MDGASNARGGMFLGQRCLGTQMIKKGGGAGLLEYLIQYHGPMTTLHDFGSVLGTAIGTLPFRPSQVHGHGSWARVRSALTS